MHPLQILIDLERFAGKNSLYNLEHIPDDKLNFKPSPTAKSALEIVHHSASAIIHLGTMLKTGEPGPDVPMPTTREEAKELWGKAIADYATFLEGLTPPDLQGDIQLGFGPFPRARAVGMPVVDLLHHHGQLAYLQTIWGDETSHFAEMGN